jgi:acetyltransferase-like isoleucine patch superfamily enzyme
MIKQFQSHGQGDFRTEEFSALGQNVVFEPGVLVFHPENITIGSNVYIGHYTILKGYYRNQMILGNDVWIGQQCFLHSAGGLSIGEGVGIGPGVKIISSTHIDPGRERPIMSGELIFGSVKIERFSDIGTGSVLLPGITVHEGTQVGAGAVVTQSTPPYSVVAGSPARVIRMR